MKVTNPRRHITLSTDMRRDLKAWKLLVQHFEWKYFAFRTTLVINPFIRLYTDETGSLGYGAIFRTSWLYGTQPLQTANCNITLKEPIKYICITRFGNLFAFFSKYLKNKFFSFLLLYLDYSENTYFHIHLPFSRFFTFIFFNTQTGYVGI